MANIETNGVDTIADAERTSSPWSLIQVFVGGNLSLSVMVFGWLTILYGLSWWEAVSAIVVGTTASAILVSFSSLLGWTAATNNSVASGAFFGVRGRLVASFIGVILCIQYVALTVWSGGDVLSESIARLTESESTTASASLSYLVISVLIVGFAVLGYRTLLRMKRGLVPAMLIFIAISIYAFAPNFDSSYAGTPDLYALGDLGPTWFLAALTAGAAGPISYVTQTGGWARYVRPDVSRAQLVASTFISMFVGLTIPTIFGAFIAVAAFDENSLAAGFVAQAPTYLLLPIVAIGIVGSLGQGGINLYSMGLDLDAILPKLSRVQSTSIVAVVSTSLVFLGKFVFDAEEAVTNATLFITCLATSWISISMIGYLRARGHFNKSDLQVFNSGKTGGVYWFSGGWNVKAILAWAIGSVAGIGGISSVGYVGPIAEYFNGIDLSIPTAAVVGGALYLVLVRTRESH